MTHRVSGGVSSDGVAHGEAGVLHVAAVLADGGAGGQDEEAADAEAGSARALNLLFHSWCLALYYSSIVSCYEMFDMMEDGRWLIKSERGLQD